MIQGSNDLENWVEISEDELCCWKYIRVETEIEGTQGAAHIYTPLSIDGCDNECAKRVLNKTIRKEDDRRYDIKIYEGREEMETIRDLKYSQMVAIVSVLKRFGVKHLVKEVNEE